MTIGTAEEAMVVLLVAAAVVALGDWAAVHARLFRLEYLLKPLTLALLLAAAVVAPLGPERPWLVTGLALGLVGDVALLAAGSAGAGRAFRTGLAAFALGHVAYVVAFAVHGVRGLDLLAGALVVAGVAALVVPRLLSAVNASYGAQLVIPLGGYSLLLGLMTVFAVGTAAVATAVGGVLFLVSDALLARERFVATTRHGRVVVIATYHAAQLLILVGLVRHL